MLQLILVAAGVAAACWLVGRLSEAVADARYRKDRLRCLRHRRAVFGRTGRLESRTPSGWLRREWNKQAAFWDRVFRGEPRWYEPPVRAK